MLELPPPDPYEVGADPPGLEMTAPTVIYLAGAADAAADRVSGAILAARPGALIVAAAV